MTSMMFLSSSLYFKLCPCCSWPPGMLLPAFTTFASTPAFDDVEIVVGVSAVLSNMLLLAVLLLLAFLLLMAFLLLLASLLIMASIFKMVALHTGLDNETY